jgi:hypothetical protein
MGLSINANGATIYRSGSYSFTRIAQSAVADAQLGIVALIGESVEGPAFAAETDGLSAVTFTSTQFPNIVAKFGSGPLVDAAKLALSPSNDPDIQGGAQQLILMKTNQSVKASLALASTYGTIKAKNYGTPGNSVNVTITGASTSRVITLNRADQGLTEVSSAIGGKGVITLASDAAPATLTISATTISTAVTGGTSTALSIPIDQFATIEELVSYLNTKPGYTATLANADQGQQPLSVLDRVSAVDITSAATVVRNAKDIQDFFATSQLVDFTVGASGNVGLPVAIAKTYLSGGLKGATTQAQFQTCLDALSASSANFIVPLYSRDATADIAAGLTDAGSTYVIASVHAAVKSHVATLSGIKGRKERQAWVSLLSDVYQDIKNAQGTLGQGRVSLVFQRTDVLKADGSVQVNSQPHMLATIAAGMKAAAVVGLPNTYKQANISGFSTRSSTGGAFFDPETDAEDGIASNLTFVEKAPGGGFRWVTDNSTYGLSRDAWYWTRPSVIYASDVAARTIRLNLETFVGRRNSDLNAETIKNFLSGVMDKLRTAGIIVADTASGGRGYKDLAVSISGNTVNVSVSLVLVEGVDWLISDIQVTRASF